MVVRIDKAPQGWGHLGWWKHCWPKYRQVLLAEAKKQNYKITPHESNWFKAYEMVPSNKVKVVIIGTDPVPDGTATGLAYDVNRSRKRPTGALNNIFNEYQSDLGYPRPRYPSLLPWAENGVLLLNMRLTTRLGRQHYHKKRMGWELLIYETLSYLSYSRPGIVWMLWGREARQLKRILYKQDQHLILESDSPAPGANRNGSKPFRGTAPFSTACEYLNEPHSMWRLV